jgi:hypothetical protein
VHIIQIDAAGNEIQDVFDRFTVNGSHTLSTFILPLATQLRIDTDQPLTADTLQFTSSPVLSTREKLSRITSDNFQDKVNIPNGEFYKDPATTGTGGTNPNGVTDWTITQTTGYGLVAGELVSTDTDIEQDITLPDLACVLLNDGCYFLRIRTVETGTITKTITLYRDDDTVISTDTFTDNNHVLNLSSEPVKMKLAMHVNGTVDKVESFLYSALTIRNTDPKTVTLTASADKGTFNELYTTESIPTWFYSQIATIPSASETRIFTVDDAALAPLLATRDVGDVLFLTGPNAGIRRKVRSYNVGTVEIYDPLPFQNNISDKLMFTLQCDKTIFECGNIFNNSINIRCEPYMPTRETLAAISQA